MNSILMKTRLKFSGLLALVQLAEAGQVLGSSEQGEARTSIGKHSTSILCYFNFLW